MTCKLRKPTALAQGYQTEERRLGQEEVEETVPEDEDDWEDVEPDTNLAQDEVVSSNEDNSAKRLRNNFCLGVFDHVKVLVETTTDFPLDLKCTLLFSEDDMGTFKGIQQEMDERAEEKARRAAIIVENEGEDDV